MKKILIFEGIEGSGKTTLIDAFIKKVLKINSNESILSLTNPINKVYKDEIEKILKGDHDDVQSLITLGNLFTADKIQAFHEKGILRNADENIIILDRFLDSYEVYNKEYVDKNTFNYVYDYAYTNLIRMNRYIYHIYVRVEPDIANKRLSERTNKEIFDDDFNQMRNATLFDNIFTKRISSAFNDIINTMNLSIPEKESYYRGKSMFVNNISFFSLINSYKHNNMLIHPISTKERCIVVDNTGDISTIVDKLIEFIIG